jgi:outer membrane protein OmpA-like peptidoglycan-associated protein
VPNPFGGAPSPVTSAAAAPAVATPPPGAATRHDPRVATLVAAGTAPLTGAAIGSYMDEEEAALRATVGVSGATVTRAGQQLVVDLPAANAFDSGKATIRTPFSPTLKAIGQVLKKYDKTVVDVYGYTDAQGSDAANKDISQRRAVSVAAGLAAAGVDQRRFFILGKGEADPIASNDTEVGRAQNRRVEIRISPIA